MLSLYDGDHVEDDLARLSARTDSGHDADMIDAFLTQLAESNDALWTLTKWSADFHNPYFNCKAISCFQTAGYNIYRIRPLGGRISRYRILYAYDSKHDDFYILAVTIKKPQVLPHNADLNAYYDYEPDHILTERAKSEYDRLQLPRVRLNG